MTAPHSSRVSGSPASSAARSGTMAARSAAHSAARVLQSSVTRLATVVRGDTTVGAPGAGAPTVRAVRHGRVSVPHPLHADVRRPQCGE
jgi:hypothetical protein